MGFDRTYVGFIGIYMYAGFRRGYNYNLHLIY